MKKDSTKHKSDYPIWYRAMNGLYSVIVATAALLSLFAQGEEGADGFEVVVNTDIERAAAHPAVWLMFGGLVLAAIATWALTLGIRSRLHIVADSTRIQEDLSGANIGAVARQLWSPVNAIGDRSAMILSEKENDEVNTRMAELINANEEVSLVINEMVDLSMIVERTMELNLKPYQLKDLIAVCRASLLEMAEKKNLAVYVACDPHIPSVLFGDPSRLQQIMVAILSNAVKYTEEGTVGLEIGMEPLFAGDIGLVITIRDTGRGMSKETADNLFDSYRNVSYQKEPGFKGTGLGMAIVKRLVDLMKGSVAVHSRLGEGTEFVLRIPQQVYDVAEVGEMQWQEE